MRDNSYSEGKQTVQGVGSLLLIGLTAGKTGGLMPLVSSGSHANQP